MKIWFLAALAAAGAAPANGDLTVTYVPVVAGFDMKMKVEIAANGDLRADMNVPSLYMIKHEGHIYFVMPGAAGPVVADIADMGAVMQEEMGKAAPNFCADLGRGMPSPHLVSRGTVTIAVNIMAISGRLKGRTKAPPIKQIPPRNSTREVIHAIATGCGTPMEWRIVAKISGPRLSFAYPWAAKPNPRIIRSGSSAQPSCSNLSGQFVLNILCNLKLWH